MMRSLLKKNQEKRKKRKAKRHMEKRLLMKMPTLIQIL